MNIWEKVVDRVNSKIPRAWKKSPAKTSGFHALMTVLGLVPFPFGPFAIWYFVVTTHSWPWLVASGISLVWYYRREYLQNGIRPKSKYHGAGHTSERTFLERWDPVLDVAVPTFAYGLLLGLLGWLW